MIFAFPYFLFVAGYFFDDLLTLNVETLTWSNETGSVHGDVPDGRSGHRLQTCNGMIYLFGGISKSGKLS